MIVVSIFYLYTYNNNIAITTNHFYPNWKHFTPLPRTDLISWLLQCIHSHSVQLIAWVWRQLLQHTGLLYTRRSLPWRQCTSFCSLQIHSGIWVCTDPIVYMFFLFLYGSISLDVHLFLMYTKIENQSKSQCIC